MAFTLGAGSGNVAGVIVWLCLSCSTKIRSKDEINEASARGLHGEENDGF